MTQEKCTFNILSIDGGDIKGIMPAIILKRLVDEVPDLLTDIDLFAGTSTGGIIALGLAHGLHINTIIELYATKGDFIFEDSLLDDIRDMGSILHSEYNNKNLKTMLTKTFGTTKLGDLEYKVLVPSFQLDNGQIGYKKRWKPKFHHNFVVNDPDYTRSVVEVGMKTSAAPTYFPIYDGHVDGGVIANNPSMCAVTQALKFGIPLEHIRLISIGTGIIPKYINVLMEN